MPHSPGTNAYRLAALVALATAGLQIWMNLAVGIVGAPDNPQNQGFYGVVAAAAACAFTARLRADATARAMLATAGVQALLTLAVGTARMTARLEPNGPTGVLLLGGGFVALWLLSAALFHRSALQASRTA